MAFLDNTGVSYLWGKIKAAFAAKTHSHDVVTTTAAGMMSSVDKARLDDIGGLSASDMADVIAAL